MDYLAIANLPSEKRMEEIRREEIRHAEMLKKEKRRRKRCRENRRKLVETLTNFICGSLTMGAFYALIVFFLLLQG